MGKQEIKPLRWPTNKEQHAYMAERAQQNAIRARSNRAENWMAERLIETGLKWTRQAQWGYRIFDFWCHKIGCAVEVDGSSHDGQRAYDAYRDRYNFLRSGIIVIRVQNFDEDGAKAAISKIRRMQTWRDRKVEMGIVGKDRRKLVKNIDSTS